VQRSPGIFRKFLGSIFFILNVLAVVWLLLCLAAAYTSPASVKYLALFSLSTPFAIAANFLFMTGWLFSSTKKYSLFSLLALTICYKLIYMIFGFNYWTKHDWKAGEDRVKIMSWNVHGLGLFNKPLNKDDKKKIAQIIQQESPDILCLPEYSMMRDGSTKKFTRQLIDSNGFVDHQFNIDNTYGYHVILGTMVFSRYPLIDFKSYDLGNMIYLVQADVKPDGKKRLRLFFVHLYSFGLSDNDREYIEKIRKNGTEIEQDLGVSKSFASKFNRAWAIRAKEADSIAAIIKQSPYPVLICGDFNDLPASYTYTTIRGKLHDVFCDKGAGLGRTYNQIFRTLRIDHMFYEEKALELLAYRSYFNTISDHNPVVANFRIKNRDLKDPTD
jgi:endonuclease/exonuclease/phosphatase family metal-dependent hydrolase